LVREYQKPIENRAVLGSVLLPLLALAFGCSGEGPPEHSDVGEANQPIYNAGDGLVALDNAVHPQAFQLSGPHGCSASLIASNVVITAAHCTNANTGASVPYVLDQST